MAEPPLVITQVVESPVAKKAAWERNEADRSRVVVPAWMVLGVFLLTDGGEPTCVDYRVRAIPDVRDFAAWVPAMKDLAESMQRQAVELLPPPPHSGGVPGYVLRRASQAVLLREARDTLARSPDLRTRLSDEAAAVLAGVGRVKAGRPPVRGQVEKLRILRMVEEAFAEGRPLSSVATAAHMSPSSLRDLLSWARHDASPRLFTALGPGRKGGALTFEARAILDQLEKVESR